MSIFLFSLGLFLAAFYIGYKIGKSSINKRKSYKYPVMKKVDTIMNVGSTPGIQIGDILVVENTPKAKRKLSPGHKKKLSKVAKSRKRVNGRFI